MVAICFEISTVNTLTAVYNHTVVGFGTETSAKAQNNEDPHEEDSHEDELHEEDHEEHEEHPGETDETDEEDGKEAAEYDSDL